MKNTQETSVGALSARRRLIKGSFAVPSAMTLCSGSVMAATTSPLTCLAKDIAAQPSMPIGPVATVQPGDTWIRVRAWVEINKSYSFIKAADVALLGYSGTTPFITGAQAICVVGGNSYLIGQIYPQAPSKPVPTNLTQSGNYFAVLMSASGRVVGISSISSVAGSGSVHGSCWNSFT